MTPPVCLTIAGTDSSGGAGVAADLRTFQAHGVWGAVAVTAVTAQNTLGVQAVELVTPEMVRAQIASVASDIGVTAAKTGMLASASIVEAVADVVRDVGIRRLVVDPVMVATSGDRLLDPEAIGLYMSRLLPMATVITPNMAEAEALLKFPVGDRASMERAALALAECGPEAVLVTGGHLTNDPSSPDCLVVAGHAADWLESPRTADGHSVHGTGCMLSAVICAQLALGRDVSDACVRAKEFVAAAISDGRKCLTNPG